MGQTKPTSKRAQSPQFRQWKRTVFARCSQNSRMALALGETSAHFAMGLSVLKTQLFCSNSVTWAILESL
jgi:hypothetical protein